MKSKVSHGLISALMASNLTSLDLSYNNLGSLGSRALLELLDTNASLTTLILVDYNVRFYDLRFKARNINTTLAHLNLSANSLGAWRIRRTVNVLKHVVGLRCLNVSCNDLSGDLIRCLSPFVRQNTYLSALYLASEYFAGPARSLCPQGFRDLFSVLDHTSYLCELDLSYNYSAINMNIVMAILNHNVDLQSLILSKCQIKDDDLKTLAPVLETNTNLISLNISRNRITVEGISILSSILDVNTTLTTLKLVGNIGRDFSPLESIVKTNYSLTELDIQCRPPTLAAHLNLNRHNRHMKACQLLTMILRIV